MHCILSEFSSESSITTFDIMSDKFDKILDNIVKVQLYILFGLVIVFFVHFAWNGDGSRITEEVGVRNYVRLFALTLMGGNAGQFILMVGGWAAGRREDAVMRYEKELKKRRGEVDDSTDEEEYMQYLED